MSDVTPKTESGRALLRDLRGSMYERLTDERTGTPIILAIEQEAASQAVAEERNAILDEVMEAIAAVPTFGEDRLLLYRSQVLNRLTDLRALIASERPSEKETGR